MSFFKPEDFPDTGAYSIEAANRANAKLEREGEVVEVKLGFVGQVYNCPAIESSSKARALLINVEPIEKKQNLASNIVNTVLKYFDINPNSPIFEQALANVEKQLSNQNTCNHPKEKVRRHIEYTKENTPGITYRESYECECGAIVKPNGFEEL